MAISLDNIQTIVENELENKAYHGTATATGDGETGVFIIAPTGYNLIENTTSVFKNSEVLDEGSDYTINLENGTISFQGIPEVGDELFFSFQYKSFSDSTLEEAIRAGVSAMFPAFYTTEIETATSDGETYEFQLDVNTEFVTKMEFKGTSSTDRYYTIKRNRYEVNREWDGDAYLEVMSVHFYTPPPDGTLRVHTICRPYEFATGMWALPERAQYPAASYACYHLLTQKMAPRVRADVAVATQGQGNVYPSQMNTAAQAFLMRFQFQLAGSRMPPWSVV